MAKYYYDKYNVHVTSSIAWQYSRDSSGSYDPGGMVYQNISISRYQIAVSNPMTFLVATPPIVGRDYYGDLGTRMASKLTVKSVNTSNRTFVYSEYYGNLDSYTEWTSAGSLIQSNIQAEDGTYPANGVHTDGFWYIRRALVNTAPTTPGVFTAPTGSLEIGDSKIISWGASTDAESNLSKYILEASINGGTWTQIATPASTSYTYTIPTATSIQFRVKAQDSAGLGSAYRTSSSLTVTKPMYYWSKYNVANVNTGNCYWSKYDTISYSKITSITFRTATSGTIYDYSRYAYGTEKIGTSYNLVNGEIVLSGLLTADHSTTLSVGTRLYGWSHGTFYRYPITYASYGYVSDGVYKPTYNVNAEAADLITEGIAYKQGELLESNIIASQNAYTSNARNSDGYWYVIGNVITAPGRGSLVQSSIQAQEGAYPTDGIQSDYWYVRGSRVNSSIAPPVSINAPTTGSVFKPGQLVAVTFAASSASNISLYEVDYKEGDGNWTAMAYNNTLSRTYTVTQNSAHKKVQFRVRAKNTSNVYSDYIYTEDFVIYHNVAPSFASVKVNGKDIMQGDSYSIAVKRDLPLKFVATDPNAGDSLQYRVLINNIEKVPYTAAPINEIVSYTILASDITRGANLVWLYVKDVSGEEVSYDITVQNKAPANYSQREVYDAIEEFLNK